MSDLKCLTRELQYNKTETKITKKTMFYFYFVLFFWFYCIDFLSIFSENVCRQKMNIDILMAASRNGCNGVNFGCTSTSTSPQHLQLQAGWVEQSTSTGKQGLRRGRLFSTDAP